MVCFQLRTTGSVVGVYDLLQEYDNYIIAETFVNIDHVLVGLKEQILIRLQLYIRTHRELCSATISLIHTRIGRENSSG